MADAATEDRISALVGPQLGALGLDLEDVDVATAGKRRLVRIAVDKDGGVSMDDVADATRAVSELLDDSEVMGERAYTLEVGSPGVDRPLTLPRHFRRNESRLVRIKLAEGEPVTGRIVDVEEAENPGVTLDVDGSELVVPLAEIREARVQIEFKRQAGED